MATVTLNPLEIGTPPQITVTGGLYQEHRFSALVTGLTENDNAILSEALNAAASAYPALDVGGASANYPGLVLEDATARVVGKAEVLIDYTFRRASGGTRYTFFFGPGYHDNGLYFTWSGGTNVTQYDTPFDINGALIQVSHTWDGSEEQPGATGRPDSTAESVSVMVPASTAIARGYLQAAYPDLLARSWAGYTNSDIWAGEPPGAWLCSSVTWEPADSSTSPVTYQFEFAFELKFGGWQPWVWYTNPNTGRPPYNVVDGVGVKQITWYPSRTFWEFFPIG